MFFLFTAFSSRYVGWHLYEMGEFPRAHENHSPKRKLNLIARKDLEAKRICKHEKQIKEH